MKRIVKVCVASTALALGIAVGPMAAVAANAATVARTVTAVSAYAVGVKGTDGQLWVRSALLSPGWHPYGGVLAGPPAVAAPANAGGSVLASPLFVAVGTNKLLYVRSLSAGWVPVGPDLGHCLGSPAAVITGTSGSYTVTVACEGVDHALWVNSAPWSGSGLPAFTSGWTDLGGVLAAGPAAAVVGATMTFFALSTNGHIYVRTLSSGYAQMSWRCIGPPAAAQAAGGVTTFACHGGNNALWVATSSGGGWSAAVSLGGSLLGGPGLALTGAGAVYFGEGTNHAVWYRTATAGWKGLGGKVVDGAGATALN